MQKLNSRKKISDLDIYEFFEFLENASVDDLDIFSNDAKAEVCIRGNNYEVLYCPTPQFPSNPKNGDFYVHKIDKDTCHTYQYNKQQKSWYPTLYTEIQKFSKWAETQPSIPKHGRPKPPQPRKLNY